MSANIEYTDESLGDVKVVPDFLPRPDEIIFKNDKERSSGNLRNTSSEGEM